MNGVVPARKVHQRALAAFSPALAADGFARVRGTSSASWQRPSADQYLVGWVQPSRQPDGFGWYGTSFTVEFRRCPEPKFGNGPGARFCRLLDDEGREQVRRVQNRIIARMPKPPKADVRQLPNDIVGWYVAHGQQITEPYTSKDDVWFRHRNEQDLDEWFELLPALLPGVLEEIHTRLG